MSILFFYAAFSKAYKQAKYYPTQEHRYFLVLHFNTDTSQSILRLLDFCVKTYQSVEPDFLTHLTWSSFLYPLTFMTLEMLQKMVKVMLKNNFDFKLEAFCFLPKQRAWWIKTKSQTISTKLENSVLIHSPVIQN